MPSDTVRDITIRGFKSIESVNALTLNPVNVLIGANGSGKSNFIGAFAFLREIGAGRLREYVEVAGGAEKILHFGSKTTQKISLNVSFSPHPATRILDVTLAPTADDGLFSVGLEGVHLEMNSPKDWERLLRRCKIQARSNSCRK
jgi:predicted ATPase